MFVITTLTTKNNFYKQKYHSRLNNIKKEPADKSNLP